MRRLVIFLILFFISKCIFAQIGVPQINSFSNQDYKGGTQNWEVGQDRNGVMYFANNEGLLSYNGKFWRLYPLPHKTIVRSLKIADDGKIYVGAQDEIGYFFPTDNGVLKFHSLKELIPENVRQLADVWNIELKNDEVYFRTTSKILKLKDFVFNFYAAKYSC